MLLLMQRKCVMKNLFYILLLVLFFLLPASAISESEVNKQDVVKNAESLKLYRVNLYDYFYKADESGGTGFKPLTKEQETLLDKRNKKIYKNVLKSEKALQKALKQEKNPQKRIQYCHKAMKYNHQNYHAIFLCALAYLNLNSFNNSLDYAKSLIELNRPDFDIAYYIAGVSAQALENYYGSIDYFTKLLKSSYGSKDFKSYVLYLQAKNYYFLKNYQKAIYCANLALQKDNKYAKENILLKYYCYYIQRNYKTAKEEAWKLVKLEPNSENYKKLADCTDDQNEKLGYLKKARSFYSNPEQIFGINVLIAIIEQNKIDKVHKNMGIYSQKPDWFKVSNENVGSIAYWNKRQDEFFETTNVCIANYKGANLARCFADVVANEKEKTVQLRRTIHETQMLYLQQQQLNALQYSNYLQRQQNYTLNRPRYTNTTVTPIGNTYYMNSYTY